MSPINAKCPVVVRLLDGQSDRQELLLEPGRPTAPLTLGKSGTWRIEGRDVAEAHVMIAWNGTSLFVGSPRGPRALLDGFPLDTRWTEVRMPSELRFGGARLSISRRADRRDDEATAPDDERLQAALRIARDEDATCIAQVIVPAEARLPAKPSPPMPRARPSAAMRPTLRAIPATPLPRGRPGKHDVNVRFRRRLRRPPRQPRVRRDRVWLLRPLR